jgi:hypothetical protein
LASGQKLAGMFYSLAMLLAHALSVVQELPRSSQCLEKLGLCAHNFRSG